MIIKSWKMLTAIAELLRKHNLVGFYFFQKLFWPFVICRFRLEMSEKVFLQSAHCKSSSILGLLSKNRLLQFVFNIPNWKISKKRKKRVKYLQSSRRLTQVESWKIKNLSSLSILCSSVSFGYLSRYFDKCMF